MTTLTLTQPFDMNAFDFSDVFNGTVTSETSTEIDYTGVSGAHYVFKGTGFGALFENYPIDSFVTDFSIVGTLDLTGSQPTEFGAIRSGWMAYGLLNGAVETGTSGDDGITAGYQSIAMGEAGNDTITAIYPYAVVDGGAGDDILTGFIPNFVPLLAKVGTTASYADATSGVFVNLETTTAQSVGGGLGHDTLSDIANLTGSQFDDRLHGNDANNILNGGRGTDHLIGGRGDDLLITHDTGSVLDGGPGFDTAQYVTSAGITLDMTTLLSVEKVIASLHDDTVSGTAHPDTIFGRDGNDTLNGNSGGDTLRGGTGDDLLNGGGGNDTADYAQTAEGVHVDLRDSDPQFISASAGTDTLVSIESATGSGFADTLIGDFRDNHLSGGSGDDILTGHNGDDIIDGGLGTDLLSGGHGSDIFVYSNLNGHNPSNLHHLDQITDFNASEDFLAFGRTNTITGVTTGFVPASLEITSATLNTATLQHDLTELVGQLNSNQAVFVTATGGDLAGYAFLVVDASYNIGTATLREDIVVEFGPGSNLAGFGMHDFI